MYVVLPVPKSDHFADAFGAFRIKIDPHAAKTRSIDPGFSHPTSQGCVARFCQKATVFLMLLADSESKSTATPSIRLRTTADLPIALLRRTSYRCCPKATVFLMLLADSESKSIAIPPIRLRTTAELLKALLRCTSCRCRTNVTVFPDAFGRSRIKINCHTANSTPNDCRASDIASPLYVVLLPLKCDHFSDAPGESRRKSDFPRSFQLGLARDAVR